ncbi:MAG: hypothetical protein AB1782_00075 [Cyanobacteriota bacterium]
MLKLDKQVNRNTLIAVSIPFLINLFIDIFSRTSYYQKVKSKFTPSNINELQAVSLNDTSNKQLNKPDKADSNKKILDPEMEKFLKSHNINTNVSFGVSYTTVHLLGKLVNKIRGAGVQTYDVYSACKELDMSNSEIRKETTLKFLREMSSQLLENIVYFSVLFKLKKHLDKNLAMAIFIPAVLTIGIDILNRSKAFNFLEKWSNQIFAQNGNNKSELTIIPKQKSDYIYSPHTFKAFLGENNVITNSNK